MEDQEYSSGCESGWTLYLEQSFQSPYQTPSPGGNNNVHFLGQNCSGFNNTDGDDEEEDSSMVSDASSGPPHFQEEEEVYNSNNVAYFCHPQEPRVISTTLLSNKSSKKQKPKENQRRKPQDLPSILDDTASSPFFNLSTNNLTLTNNQASMEEDMVDFSQGYSTTTHFERKSTFQDHFGYYHSPVSGSQLQQNQWFEEKRMGMR